jgi:hypothetical protein
MTIFGFAASLSKSAQPLSRRQMSRVCVIAASVLVSPVALAASPLKLNDLTYKDLEAPKADPGVCATGYQRAFILRNTPEDAPLVFVDRANSALIKLDGKLIELKSVAHLDRDSERTRSYAAPEDGISVEQVFRTSKEKKGVLEIPVLRGSIKVTTPTGSVTLTVVGKPYCQTKH